MADPEIWKARTMNPSFATRAARILKARGWWKADPTRSNSSSNDVSEKTGNDLNPGFTDYADGLDAQKENIDRRRDVRSLPPWIAPALREDDEIAEVKTSAGQRLNYPVKPPAPIKPAHHNFMPDPKTQFHPEAGRGKGWHHARSRDAVTPKFPQPDHLSRWRPFIQASHYRRSEEGEMADEQWLRNNMPDLDEPYEPTQEPNEGRGEGIWLLSEQKRNATMLHLQRVMLKNPFVPLFLRLTVIAFACTALGLGVQIYSISKNLNNSPSLRAGVNSGNNTTAVCKQQTSTYLAFIVDIFAVVYLVYITYDEYFSKPLGLRSTRAKMRLLFLDLLFIIFAAANLSLAFNTLTDQQWSCYDSPVAGNNNNQEAAQSTCVEDATLCSRQRALCSVLVVAEMAWVLTFATSIMRVIERIQH